MTDVSKELLPCPVCACRSHFSARPSASFCDTHYRQYLATFQITPKDLAAYREQALSDTRARPGPEHPLAKMVRLDEELGLYDDEAVPPLTAAPSPVTTGKHSVQSIAPGQPAPADVVERLTALAGGGAFGRFDGETVEVNVGDLRVLLSAMGVSDRR